MTRRKEAGSEQAVPRAGYNGPDCSMIICSCNVLSDHDVRVAVQTAAPRTTFQVYGCLGCSAQCGRCAHTIRKIMDEARPAANASAGRGRAVHATKIAEALSTLPQLQTT